MPKTTWTDPDIIPYVTRVKDVHIEEMRTAINNLELGSSGYYTSTRSDATYTITDTACTSYVTGDHFYVLISDVGSWTTGADINILLRYNSLPSKSLLKYVNKSLVGGDLIAGQIIEVVFDGTNFQWVNATDNTSTSPYPTGTNTGTVDALVTNIAGVTSYTDGMELQVTTTGSNTGAVTVNVSGVGTVGIKRPDGTDLLAGDIVIGTQSIVYNNYLGYFQLKSQMTSGSNPVKYCVSTLGTANAAVVTIPGVTAYSKGMIVSFRSLLANTGSTTLKVNSLDAKPIVKRGYSYLEAGDILPNMVVTCVYDGSNFFMVNPGRKDMYWGVAGGTAAAITCAVNDITAYYDGLMLNLYAAYACTGATTINVNSLGAISIYKSGSTELTSNDFVAGQTVSLMYYGGSFKLVGGTGGVKLTVASSAPSSPATNDLWIDTSS